MLFPTLLDSRSFVSQFYKSGGAGESSHGADVFRQATGSTGGTTGLTVVILFLITMITISAFASTSRQTFAFARDRGLPFSSWLGQVTYSLHSSADFGSDMDTGTREVASASQLGAVHHRLHHPRLLDQHWQHCCVQRATQSVHGGSDGDLRHLDRLCSCEKVQYDDTTSSSAMESWSLRTSNQHHRANLCYLGILLVVLAQRARCHRRQLQLCMRALCWIDDDKRGLVLGSCSEGI
jgi:hypothetical protein